MDNKTYFIQLYSFFYIILRCAVTSHRLAVCLLIHSSLNIPKSRPQLCLLALTLLFCFIIRKLITALFTDKNNSVIFRLLKVKFANSLKNLYLNCTKPKLIFRRWIAEISQQGQKEKIWVELQKSKNSNKEQHQLNKIQIKVK